MLKRALMFAAGIVAGIAVGFGVAPSTAAPTAPVNGVCLDIHPLEGWTVVTASVTYARDFPSASGRIVDTMLQGRSFGFTQVAFDGNDNPWLMTGRGNWVFAARTAVDIPALAAY